MVYGHSSRHDGDQSCKNCGRKNWTNCGECVDCEREICDLCAGCNIEGVLTCHTCINDLLEAGADDEPEEQDPAEPDCTCEQVDADRFDASGCELHSRVIQ